MKLVPTPLQGMSYQLRAIRKLCQDACKRLMLHPYITVSRTMVNIFTSHAQRERGKVIGVGVHIVYVYMFVDQKKFLIAL